MHSCRTLSLVALAATTLGLVGCHSAPPPPPLPPGVELLSPDLYGKLNVAPMPHVEGGLLFVQCQATNWTPFPMEIEYMFHFYDQAGIELVDPNARWALAQFGPNETKALNKNAPGPTAKNFKVSFRWSSTIH